MKLPRLLAASLLAGHVSAFKGTLNASPYYQPQPGYIYQELYLKDSYTGSSYTGVLYGGFNACTTEECYVYFVENIAGGYNFNAHVWRTNDGCHNIDFLGYLDAGHGYCCGSLPCYLTA